MRIVIIAIVITTGLALVAIKVGNHKSPALPATFTPPTATEVFNLRTKCAQLARRLDESKVYGSNWRRDTMSNYSARENRCYVEMTDLNDSLQEYTRSLYDGQTGDILAHVKSSYANTGGKRGGMVFIGNHRYAGLDCSPGGDCGFSSANDLIDQKMKRDE